MRLSNTFLPVLREIPRDAEVASHRLMLKAGMIQRQSAGIYSWLPLGCMILRKIEAIVCEEQNRIGAQQILMPTIQQADIWKRSGRYDDYGMEMLRLADRHGHEMLYGPTNEEMATEIFKSYVQSYRKLPLILYQVQWKFRDEIRPRFGVMRGREFLMKDAYSFDLDYSGAYCSYNKMFLAYLRTFDRIGLKAIPMQADSGPIGGDSSHEFLILSPTGESSLFFDKRLLELPIPETALEVDDNVTEIVKPWISLYAAADEKHNPEKFDSLPTELQASARGIEVGHTFYFGTKYSAAMNAKVACSDGSTLPVHMGSYGIGISRLVAAIIEANHDEKGIIWPDCIAPFDVALLDLNHGTEKTKAISNRLYYQLRNAGVMTLYDDTDEHAGAKLASADLMGAPWQIIVGTQNASKDLIELKRRSTGERHIVSCGDAVEILTQSYSLGCSY